MHCEAEIPPNFGTIKYNWGIQRGSGNIYSTEGIQQLKRRIPPPGTSERWATHSSSAPAVLQTTCAHSRALLFTSTPVYVPCNYLLYIYMNTNKTWDSVWAQTPFIEIEVTFRNPESAITSFSCPTLRPHSHVQCTNLFPNSSRIKSNCYITKFQLTGFVFFEFRAKLKWKQEAGEYSPHRAVFTAQMLSMYLGNTLPTF